MRVGPTPSRRPTRSSSTSDRTRRPGAPAGHRVFRWHNGGVLKKVITLLVVGFIIYYLLNTPASAADAVSDAFGAIMDAFRQFGVFFNELVE